MLKVAVLLSLIGMISCDCDVTQGSWSTSRVCLHVPEGNSCRDIEQQWMCEERPFDPDVNTTATNANVPGNCVYNLTTNRGGDLTARVCISHTEFCSEWTAFEGAPAPVPRSPLPPTTRVSVPSPPLSPTTLASGGDTPSGMGPENTTGTIVIQRVDKTSGWSAGDIIGLVVVGVGILCALLLGLFFCRRYKLLNILCHDRDEDEDQSRAFSKLRRIYSRVRKCFTSLTSPPTEEETEGETEGRRNPPCHAGVSLTTTTSGGVTSDGASGEVRHRKQPYRAFSRVDEIIVEHNFASSVVVKKGSCGPDQSCDETLAKPQAGILISSEEEVRKGLLDGYCTVSSSGVCCSRRTPSSQNYFIPDEGGATAMQTGDEQQCTEDGISGLRSFTSNTVLMSTAGNSTTELLPSPVVDDPLQSSSVLSSPILHFSTGLGSSPAVDGGIQSACGHRCSHDVIDDALRNTAEDNMIDATDEYKLDIQAKSAEATNEPVMDIQATGCDSPVATGEPFGPPANDPLDSSTRKEVKSCSKEGGKDGGKLAIAVVSKDTCVTVTFKFVWMQATFTFTVNIVMVLCLVAILIGIVAPLLSYLIAPLVLESMKAGLFLWFVTIPTPDINVADAILTRAWFP